MNSYAEKITPQEEDPVEKAIREINARRSKVYEVLDGMAYNSAVILAKTLTFQAKDELDLKSRRLNLDAAWDILDRTGFDPTKKVEHSGQVSFEPLKISRGDDESPVPQSSFAIPTPFKAQRGSVGGGA